MRKSQWIMGADGRYSYKFVAYSAKDWDWDRDAPLPEGVQVHGPSSAPGRRTGFGSPYVDVEDGEVSLEAMKGHMEKLEAMWKSMGGSFIGWDHTSGRQTMLAFFGHPRLQRPSRETLNVHEVRDSYKHRPICSVALAHIMAIPEPCILGAAQLSRGPLSGGAWSGVCRGIRPAGER